MAFSMQETIRTEPRGGNHETLHKKLRRWTPVSMYSVAGTIVSNVPLTLIIVSHVSIA